VQATAASLRDLIFSAEPDACIGSLGDLARQLGVGVVTVQQVARILEHEGLLEVRRGPGGGYYGRRPTEASLERSIAAYLQVDGSRYHEIFEMMSLLECELAPAAVRCEDPELREHLLSVRTLLLQSDTVEKQVAVEKALHDVLFRMVDKPLMSLLGRVTVEAYRSNPASSMFLDEDGVEAWREGRLRILQAILLGDEELARFETRRYRDNLLERLQALHGEFGPAG
jgi:GntR family transcriptional repressor for pyruvate dehydrogenase complex